jgi:3-carboxy-cis,cis-muconate cycloisomerase
VTPSQDEPGPDGDASGGGRSLLSPVVAGTPVERLTHDGVLLAAMVETESALAGVLAEAGLVPAPVAEVVARVCAELDPGAYDLDDLAARATQGGNPVIPLVEDLRARVAAVDPDAATVVHRGATSQDVLDTALMLMSRRVLAGVAEDLRRAGAHAAHLADEHRGTPCCGRTLGQQAMPTTFGFRAAGWLAGLTDALRRVDAVAAALPVQLGGPVGTTGAYAEHGPGVVESLAARLGLTAPALAWHTRRTPVADLGHALAVATGAAGKIAADVVVMSASEVGELDEGAGGSSSSMAHKSNPVQSVLVSAAARQVPALVAVLEGSLAAEQERPPGAWHAEWEPLRQAMRLCGAAVHRCAGVLAGLHVHPEEMRRNLDHLVARADLDADAVAATPVAVAPWIDRALSDYGKASS